MRNIYSFRYWLSESLRKFDIFGHPVTLRYKNHPDYKSELGGFVSLIFVLGIAGYFSFLLGQNLTQ